jgi:hypothetical protein
MTCYDCAARGEVAPAVAICVSCGAALCMAHAVLDVRYLTRTAVINRVETVDTPARVVHCQVCAAAIEAQSLPAPRHHHVGSR